MDNVQANNKSSFRVALGPLLLLPLLLALAGCGPGLIRHSASSTPYYTPGELERMAPKDPRAGYLYVHTGGGNIYYPRSLKLNGEPLVVTKEWRAYVELPVAPGRYVLEYSNLEMRERPRVHPPIELDVAAGQSIHLIHSKDTVYDRLSIGTPEAFAKLTLEEQRMRPIRPVSAYMPGSLRNLALRCQSTASLETCRQMLDAIPATVLPDDARAVAERVEREHEVTLVRERLEPRLPPQVRHDKYMLALTQALATKNYSAAVPVFEELERLGGPRDPEIDFFHGETLVELGRPVDAITPLSRYVREQGASARYYNEALQLLNRAQEAL